MLSNENISRKRKIIYALFIAFIILSLLAVRIGIIQFIQGDELKAMAYKQQSLDRKINPKRGTIYDRYRKKCFSSKCNSRNSYG